MPKYRVTHLLADLGWVDLDLGCSIVLLGQHRSCRTAQPPVEHPKSKSTQPRSGRRWVTLYVISSVVGEFAPLRAFCNLNVREIEVGEMALKKASTTTPTG